MKTNSYLNVTGILMIIFGSLAVLLGIIAVLGVATLAAFGANSILLTIGSILSIVSAVVELIAGIKGVKGAKDPAKGVKCIGWGITTIVLAVLAQVITVLAGGNFSVLNLLIGLVLPVLYTIGALTAEKAQSAAE